MLRLEFHYLDGIIETYEIENDNEMISTSEAYTVLITPTQAVSINRAAVRKVLVTEIDG